MFAGPVLPAAGFTARLPEWRADLDGRTVVHVTQGTIDNQDLSTLTGPTLRALAGEYVLTVAATGGRSIGSILGPARQRPGRRVHPQRPPHPAGGRDGHQRRIRRSPIRALMAYRQSSPAQPKTNPKWPPVSTGQAPESTSAPVLGRRTTYKRDEEDRGGVDVALDRRSTSPEVAAARWVRTAPWQPPKLG